MHLQILTVAVLNNSWRDSSLWLLYDYHRWKRPAEWDITRLSRCNFVSSEKQTLSSWLPTAPFPPQDVHYSELVYSTFSMGRNGLHYLGISSSEYSHWMTAPAIIQASHWDFWPHILELLWDTNILTLWLYWWIDPLIIVRKTDMSFSTLHEWMVRIWST